jgi:methionine sulfoxide reductase heme-binding subunit
MSPSLKNDTDFQLRVVSIAALVPPLLAAWDWRNGRLGSNPVEFTTRITGVLSLVFLVITLLVTPLRQLLGMSWLLKLRRRLGLYAFYYGLAHLLTYLAWDRGWSLASVGTDVVNRPFIALGMFAFLAMVPLAVTSTNTMIKRLGGKRWALLHKLTYPIVIAGVAHYWMIVKSDLRWPVAFALVTALLLGWRLRAVFAKKTTTNAANHS